MSRPESMLIRQKMGVKKEAPLSVVSVLQYCLCAEPGHLPSLVRRGVAMLHAFTIGFRKLKRVVFDFSWLCLVQY